MQKINKKTESIEGGLVRLSSPPMIEIKFDFHGIHFSDIGLLRFL